MNQSRLAHGVPARAGDGIATRAALRGVAAISARRRRAFKPQRRRRVRGVRVATLCLDDRKRTPYSTAVSGMYMDRVVYTTSLLLTTRMVTRHEKNAVQCNYGIG